MVHDGLQDPYSNRHMGQIAEASASRFGLSRKGERVVDRDEEPFKVDFAKLSSLRAAFGPKGTITAGNASTINDGAALALLAGPGVVARYGLQPQARLVAYASNSLHPDRFTEAPVGAIEKACAKAA